MANEPELRAGGSGEWVLYLQEALNHHYQQTVIAESGEFDTGLEAVVQHFQQQQGLESDGVVDAATWAALTGQTSATRASSQHADGHGDGRGDGRGGGAVHPTDAPALGYSWPDVPVATASVDVGAALVELALTLTGESTVTFPDGANTDHDALGAAAGHALDGLTDQVSVDGLGSAEPKLSAAVDAEFRQAAASPRTADRIEFSGDCQLDYQVPTDHGRAAVAGRLGYRLAVTVTAHADRDERPVPDSAPSWLERHAEHLAEAGPVVLVTAFAIAPGQETGGASLVPLGA